MKYIVLLCDGMSDYPVPQLENKTPMMVAKKPNMDFLALNGEVGLIKTVPDGYSPGSDVANLSVMGYNPSDYYTGRSPLEAISMGIKLADNEIAMRCNLVTVSDEENYEDKRLIDYCADDISTEEAKELIEYLESELGNEIFTFYPGISYRHCLIWKDGTTELGKITPPHDITGKAVFGNLPETEVALPLLDLMKKSYDLLKDHPVNQKRIARGKLPANSIWLWGQGSKPMLDKFEDKFGVKGSVISAVDLLKGIGIGTEMTSIDVEGATGYLDTNFEGKVGAGLAELERGQDFIYLHYEAPDECGHRGEVENKVKSIEEIDARVLAPLLKGLEQYDNYRIAILPDHPTPLSLQTHVSDAVPYIIYEKAKPVDSGVSVFSEESAKATGRYIAEGHRLMSELLKK